VKRLLDGLAAAGCLALALYLLGVLTTGRTGLDSPLGSVLWLTELALLALLAWVGWRAAWPPAVLLFLGVLLVYLANGRDPTWATPCPIASCP
jgi:hypothetical protein